MSLYPEHDNAVVSSHATCTYVCPSVFCASDAAAAVSQAIPTPCSPPLTHIHTANLFLSHSHDGIRGREQRTRRRSERRRTVAVCRACEPSSNTGGCRGSRATFEKPAMRGAQCTRARMLPALCFGWGERQRGKKAGVGCTAASRRF